MWFPIFWLEKQYTNGPYTRFLALPLLAQSGGLNMDSLIHWFLFFSLQRRLRVSSSLLIGMNITWSKATGCQLPGHINEKQNPLWSEDSDGFWVMRLAESFLLFGLRRRVGVLVCVPLSPTCSPNLARWSHTSSGETNALNIRLAMSSKRPDVHVASSTCMS